MAWEYTGRGMVMLAPSQRQIAVIDGFVQCTDQK